MKPRIPVSGPLLFACLLSVLLLLLGIRDLRDGFAQISDSQVMASIFEQVRASPVTMGRVYAFAAKVLALYLLFGAMVWGLSRLTLAASARLVRHRYLVVLGWFMTLALLLGLVNAELYPWSHSGRWSRMLADVLSPGVPAWTLLAMLILVVVGALLVRLARPITLPRHALRAGVWTVVVICVVIVIRQTHAQALDAAAPSGSQRPNVVLLGIDSLRPTLVGQRGVLGYTPALSRYMQSAHWFTDATTPLARTFPSWMAMLTGRRPARSGIRENLMPRGDVKVTTLAQTLGAQGYQTVYATDEVRFSNIDRSYGFERTLTPRIGASDFILGSANDLPLTNLFANTFVARWLFPETYANRAAAVTYAPQSFLDRLQSEVQPDGRPLFLAMHLSLPHWPYRWRADQDAIFADTSDTAYAYLAAVVQADRQFEGVMRLLERKGLLHNTLVVIISDHGEALNLPMDRLVQVPKGSTVERGVQVWLSGHGTSVLSGTQFQIVLGARAFGIPGYPERAFQHSLPVSIEDVAPTVLEVAGVKQTSSPMDGYSFGALLRADPAESAATSAMRIRYTESAYSTPSLRLGVTDEHSLIEEGADVFRVSADTGWVEVRADKWSELMAVRERAAIGPTQLLAALPAEKRGEARYLLVPRSGGEARKLLSRPDAAQGEEAVALWDGLNTEYRGELGMPVP